MDDATTGNAEPSAASAPLTIAELKRRCNYGRIREGWAAGFFVRPIAAYLTWLLIKLRFTANMATALCVICCLAGAVLIAIPNNALILTGIALYMFGVLLDSSDGDLARFHRTPSARGIYLDNFGHIIALPMFWLAISMFLFQRFGRWEIILIGSVAVILGRNAPWLAVCETFAGLIEKQQIDLLGNVAKEPVQPIPSKPYPADAPLKERVLDLLREPFLNLIFLLAVAIDTLTPANGRITGVMFLIYIALTIPLNGLRLWRNMRGDWVVRYCGGRLQQANQMLQDSHER